MVIGRESVLDARNELLLFLRHALFACVKEELIAS